MTQNIKNFGMAVLFIAAMSGFAALVIETFNQIDMENRIKMYVACLGLVVLANCNNYNNQYVFWTYTGFALLTAIGSIKYKK